MLKLLGKKYGKTLQDKVEHHRIPEDEAEGDEAEDEGDDDARRGGGG